jgi:transketolase
VLYSSDEQFPIGGCKVLRKSERDRITVVAAGITLHEVLHAYKELEKDGISICIIDLYSIKPIDTGALREAASRTKAIITVEDHFAEGGLGEAIMAALADSPTPIYTLAVKKMPKSGKPHELLDYEEISRSSIIRKIRELL